MNKTQSERLILDPDDTEQLTDIFAHCCPNAVIWAYGSRVGGNAHSGSDLDLAIKDLGANALSIPMIRSVLDESTLPFRVDLHVFDELPKPFHKEIEKKHVVFFEGIHQMFLNSFGKTFFSDSLFKMLHEHGTKVFTDPKEWDHSCNRQGRCPNLIGSHGHYEIKGHDDQERDVSSPEEKKYIVLTRCTCFNCLEFTALVPYRPAVCMQYGNAFGEIFVSVFRKVLRKALQGYGKFFEDGREVNIDASKVTFEPDFITAWGSARRRYPSSKLIVLFPWKSYFENFDRKYLEAFDHCTEKDLSIVPYYEPANETKGIDCGLIFPPSAIEIICSSAPYFRQSAPRSNNVLCYNIDARVLPTEQITRFRCPPTAE